MYTKKVRCTRKVVVLPSKPIVVLDVLVAVASLDGKVPTKSQTAWRMVVFCSAQYAIALFFSKPIFYSCYFRFAREQEHIRTGNQL